uniref:Ig-like domain-containing protein n=1 Tax=Sphenodon punctatus TaxID=8508 RepID=A0A8D0HT94_SPHPU
MGTSGVLSVAVPLLSLLAGLSLRGSLGAGGKELEVLQPQAPVRVSPGQNFTLNCSVTEMVPLGGTGWFKGSGRDQKTIYTDKKPIPRTTRIFPGSNTDFTIRISEARPEDTGTYYCVKFRKVADGSDEEYKRGPGTVVSVADGVTDAAVGTACALIILLLLLVAVGVYLIKRRGRSPDAARLQAPSPDNLKTPNQAKADQMVLYADLHHSGHRQTRPQKTAPEKSCEYAVIQVTRSVARERDAASKKDLGSGAQLKEELSSERSQKAEAAALSRMHPSSPQKGSSPATDRKNALTHTVP